MDDELLPELLAKKVQLKKASWLVRANSMEVNREFSEIEDEIVESFMPNAE